MQQVGPDLALAPLVTLGVLGGVMPLIMWINSIIF
jgi:hypothetical protein